MTKIYRVQMNSKGAPDFSTAVEIPSSDNHDWEKYSDKLWKIAYERGKGDRPRVVYMAQRIEEAPSIDICFCRDCEYKRLYDEGDTKYYYCALEDRPNRQWSVDDTDFCSWGERKDDDIY